MKISLAGVAFFATFLCFGCMAEATDYYVSRSSGSDVNDGLTSETPWQTLEKVSSHYFRAGDNIYLKSGDEWNETLYAKGEGNSESWITLTSYGDGAKPKISAGFGNVYGIFLEDYAGWRFKDLEICNAQAGIRALFTKNPEKHHDGLWFEDLYVHDIYNGPQNPNNREPGLFMSYGISTYKVLGRGLPAMSNVTMKNCLIEHTDAPATLASINNLFIENVTMRYSYKEGILFSTINEDPDSTGYMKNCTVLNSGYNKGMYWGVAGVQFNSTRNFEMSDCEIAYTKAPGCPDGCGVDFEGTDSNVTLRNNYIHDNEGVAIMIYRNPTWGSNNKDIYIIGNRAENNCLKNPQEEQSFLRHRWNEDTKVYVEDNKIKLFEGQPAVSLDLEPLEVDAENGILVGKWPDTYQVSNNTVEIVPLGEYASYSTMPTDLKTKTVKRWEFEDNTEGFFAKNGLSELTVEDGALAADIIEKDPYFLSPDNMGIDMNKNTVIKLRMRQTTTSTMGRIYFTTTTSTAWDEGKAKGFYIHDPDGGYVDYIIDMQYCDAWKGTLKQLRIDPIDNSGVLGKMSIDYIEIAENLEGVREVFEMPDVRPITVLAPTKSAINGITKEYGWDFDEDNEGWTATTSGAIINMQANEGALMGEIAARDPYIVSPDNLGYDVTGMRYVGVKYKNDTGRTSAKIYFRNAGVEKFSDDRAVSATVAQYDTERRLYVFDMQKNSYWTGIITQLRFDPIDNADNAFGTFDIDYIYIGNEDPMAVGDAEPAVSVPVPDDINGHWAYTAIMYMLSCGATGTDADGYFDPDGNMSRGETADMLAKALKLKTVGYSGRFTDVKIGAEQANSIERVYRAGVMQGDGESFRPESTLTRQEVAVIVANAMLLFRKSDANAEVPGFSDSGSIAEWAIPSVAMATSEGLIRGMDDGSFRPLDTLTRAQTAELIYRIIEWSKR